jgi:hypothetical protein
MYNVDWNVRVSDLYWLIMVRIYVYKLPFKALYCLLVCVEDLTETTITGGSTREDHQHLRILRQYIRVSVEACSIRLLVSGQRFASKV